MAQGRETTSPYSRLLRNQVPLLALVAVCVITAVLSDRFLSPVNLNNILLQACVMSVIAMGMTFVIISGGFDLSVGSTVALSGTVATWVMLETHWSVGVTAGIAAGALVGYINGLIVARLRVNPFITTLGSMVVVRGIVLLITDGRPIVGDEGLPDTFLELGRARLFGVHLLVWLPQSSVVYAGDTVFAERMLGILPDSAGRWIKSLEYLRDTLKPRIVVPGHGAVTNIDRAMRDSYDYLVFLRGAVTKRFADGAFDPVEASQNLDQSRFSHLKNYEDLGLRSRNALAVAEEVFKSPPK